MSILSRYILKSHAGPFVFGFVIITFILVMEFLFTIINLIIGKGLGVWLVTEIFVLNLAWIVALSIPMAVLVATLMAFGRLSADNEITALKAGGVSLYRMIAPVMMVSVVLTAGLILFNDVVLPEANYRARGLMADVHRARPTLTFKEGIFMEEFPGYSILIDRINPRSNEVSRITIYEMPASGPPRVLTAERGELNVAPDGSRITITLFNGELHRIDPETPGRYFKEIFGRQRVIIRGSPRGVVRSGQSARGDREMTIEMMRARIDQLNREIEASRSRLAQLAQDGGADAESRVSREHQERQLIKIKTQQINGYLVEIYKKYAIPVACMVFVLVGAPLGLIIRRSGLAISVGVSLGFFLLYWACLIGGEELANRSLVSPFWAMWSANVMIGAAGVLLMIRIGRERPLWRW